MGCGASVPVQDGAPGRGVSSYQHTTARPAFQTQTCDVGGCEKAGESAGDAAPAAASLSTAAASTSAQVARPQYESATDLLGVDEDDACSTNRVPTVTLGELVAGLEHALASQLALAVAEAVGVDAAADVNIAPRLLEARGRGSEVVDKYCLPKMRDVLERELWAFAENTMQTVRDANGKYAEDPTTYSASYGLEEHFYQGLDEFNGRPDGDHIEEQMRREFNDLTPFTTRNYGGIETNLKTEWEFVVAPKEGEKYPGEEGKEKGDGSRHPGRQRMSLDELMGLALTKDSELQRAEVIAVRLYTGPAYMQLNLGLRSGGRKAQERDNVANFPATCSALNSAIKKLAKKTPLPRSHKLYRGLTGMALPNKVLEKRRFVELAFSSATPSKAVALSYAGTDRASVFEIEVGGIDRGADISEYSQYPNEEEHVIPPLSHFEILKVRREGSINCYVLRLNVNLRALTLEEIFASRKYVVARLAQRLAFEAEEKQLDAAMLRALLHSEKCSVRADKITALKHSDIDPVDAEWFNDPSHFKDIICLLVDAYAEDLRAAAQRVLPAGRDRRNTPVDQLVALKSAGQLLWASQTTDGDKEDLVAVQREMLALPGLH
jgi:hypothetical protein